MSNARRSLACSVFEGRIVVSGGSNIIVNLNTVEAYDHVGDTWENMPNMINERFCHKSVAVKNKLFLIGGMFTNNCEVFDSNTKTYTLLKQPTLASGFILYHPTEVITVGNKLFIFKNDSCGKTYDFKNKKWSVKTCEVTKNIRCFSLLKYF